MYMYVLTRCLRVLWCVCTQVSSLERELEETRQRAAQFEEEAEEQSQGQDMQLLDSQVIIYHVYFVHVHVHCMCIHELVMPESP